mmetsp:Transcript_34462/g.72624  ORF Transcript_34462/g.72624 Transcript_34462/m.72624 type:complete len:217 (-) Transcript_34462:356-1006(-)
MFTTTTTTTNRCTTAAAAPFRRACPSTRSTSRPTSSVPCPNSPCDPTERSTGIDTRRTRVAWPIMPWDGTIKVTTTATTLPVTTTTTTTTVRTTEEGAGTTIDDVTSPATPYGTECHFTPGACSRVRERWWYSASPPRWTSPIVPTTCESNGPTPTLIWCTAASAMAAMAPSPERGIWNRSKIRTPGSSRKWRVGTPHRFGRCPCRSVRRTVGGCL